MRSPIVVVGAGFGGLAAAVTLATRGEDVLVLERGARPGGKARLVEVGGRPVPSGPTVLTMRWVFDELFDAAGKSLDAAVQLRPLDVVARNFFSDGTTLDLTTDAARNADAIGALAGAAEGRAYAQFAAYAKAIADTVVEPFLRSERPSPFRLVAGARRIGLSTLARIDAHRSMWTAISSTFRDPRLRMLFARYATYVGSSPFAAPATLNLVSHVEREGVSVVEGGIPRLAWALAELGRSLGVELRYGCTVRDVVVRAGRVASVIVETEGVRSEIPARAVIANADVASVASGWLGASAASAVSAAPSERRSLSALTWSMVADVRGSLSHHDVFFPHDYAAEHGALFDRRILPEDPTVYLCASDREASVPDGEEAVFAIVNAPACADERPLEPEEIDRCEKNMMEKLARSGISLSPRATVVTTPTLYETLAPGTGGAIYGAASCGALSALTRPSSRTRLPGFFLAGGSVHPGAGVPMAALSGRTCARAVLSEQASPRRSRAMAIAGSTWMW
jgi:1-hydroxycarotenoid 3,4-desaturase